MAELINEWESIFETGNDKVDKEHRKMFELVKELSMAYLLNKDKEVISKILFKLEDYSKTHFCHEENLLAMVKGLPSDIHIKQHEQFCQHIYDLKFDFISEDKPITLDLLIYLSNWLREHILGLDMIELREFNAAQEKLK